MSWPIASGLGAGLAVATLVVAPGSAAAWFVLAANVAALVRQYRTGSDYARGCREGRERGYAAGVADERQRVVQAMRRLVRERTVEPVPSEKDGAS